MKREGEKIRAVLSMASTVLVVMLRARTRTYRCDTFAFYFVTRDTSVRQGRTFQSLK